MKLPKEIKLVLAILGECRDVADVTEMKLYKLMYFCETNYYLAFNKRLTQLKYLKNSFGPTPCKSPDFLKQLKAYVDFVENKYRHYFLKHQINPKELAEGIDYDFIRDEVRKYKYLSASELSKLSHQDTPFLMAKSKSYINIEDAAYRDDEETDPQELEKERREFENAFSPKAKERAVEKINQILQECHP